MRSKPAKIRTIQAEAVYGHGMLAKLINRVMKDGKKSIAQKQVYLALTLIKERLKKEPIEVFEAALKNITPQMEVRSRRVGGAAYQVPMPVRPRRAESLALRWLVGEANKRSSKEFKGFAEKLAAEIIDATNQQGGAIQKKLGVHKMADANKAFSHFRW